VLCGLQGAGKTTVVNRLVACLLEQNSAVGQNEGEEDPQGVFVDEKETLIPTGGSASNDAAAVAAGEAFTSEERAAQEYGDVCRTAGGRRSLALVEVRRRKPQEYKIASSE
jgi:GTPase SAR1 family protein